MKAPDVIFVHAVTKPIPEISFSEIKEGDDDIEYIRKDALLDWAKIHKCMIEMHGGDGDDYLRGEYSMLNSLIDKLNSI